MPLTIFWFRRDLRTDDNAGLSAALQSKNPVLCLFIYDTEILSKLSDKKDPRVEFIHERISILDLQLRKSGSTLLVKHGKPASIFTELLAEFDVQEVFTNHDYEPYALERDKKIQALLKKSNIPFRTFKDQVIFEKSEVINEAGLPYKVFTPYKNKWQQHLNAESIKSCESEKLLKNLFTCKAFTLPPLAGLGFEKSNIGIPSPKLDKNFLQDYGQQRDFPEPNKTSMLGIHLRFGTVSIRKMVSIALESSDIWLNELIWREFFMQLLFHFPYVVNEPFQKKFRLVNWRHDEEDFRKWTEGMTGYPMVDAGMRQLNATGFMHNRARMITASFLTKHLFIDWRWGETYFAEKLLDFELSSNNGNWQWAAGTGADAQPYFRIFNPVSQQEKFDPDFKYIKKWIPEFGKPEYPKAMIDHKTAVQRAKENFNKALSH
ncbi:MAG: cryptochrome/photolyase family protein [Cytophagaceae bacterium]